MARHAYALGLLAATLCLAQAFFPLRPTFVLPGMGSVKCNEKHITDLRTDLLNTQIKAESYVAPGHKQITRIPAGPMAQLVRDNCFLFNDTSYCEQSTDLARTAYPVNARALCPWKYVQIATPEGSYPASYYHAVLTDEGHSDCEQLTGHHQCRPINDNIEIMEKGSCYRLSYTYTKKAIPVAIGYACIKVTQ